MVSPPRGGAGSAGIRAARPWAQRQQSLRRATAYTLPPLTRKELLHFADMDLARHNLKYLYKYRSVVDAERVLVQRSIRCSHPSTFNDLLDGQVSLRLPPTDTEFREQLFREYLKLIDQVPPPVLRPGVGQKLVALCREIAPRVSRDELVKHLREGIQNIEEENGELERLAGDRLRSSAKGALVLCLSQEPASLAMWYHYADQYRGVVLAFDCQSVPDSMFGVAQQVEYATAVPHVCDRDEWIKVCTGQLQYPLGIAKPLYLTKSAEWGYEQEWRLIPALGGPGSVKDLPLVAGELGGIVLGPKTPEAEAERLAGLAKTWRPSCVVWKAELDYSKYGLRIIKVA